MYLYLLIQIDAFVVNENQGRNFPKCKRRIPEVAVMVTLLTS